MSDYFIGLTGGIASGKSALEKAFAAHGIVVADADLLAREVVAPGEPALAAVVERFGAGVLQVDGQLDRAALRVRVFGDPEQRRALEAILHPAIRARLEAICRAAPGPMPSPRSRCSPRAAAAQRIRGCTASWWWTLPLPCRRRG